MLRFDIIRDFAQVSSLILSTMTFKIPDVNFEFFSKFYSVFSFDVPFIFPSIPPFFFYVVLFVLGVIFVVGVFSYLFQALFFYCWGGAPRISFRP